MNLPYTRTARSSFLAAPVARALDSLVQPDDDPAAGGIEPGVTVGNYRIDRLLGRGGMGAVFLASDTRLYRHVAVKIVATPPETSLAGDRVLREARNAAALTHPGICTIHEVGHAPGVAFIAMEYVAGRSLRHVIDEGALPVSEAVRLGIQAADALAYAHDRGVVHRDFKAANVMLGEEGHLKIVDFGLARRDVTSDASGSATSSIVPAGVAAGTPYAMAAGAGSRRGRRRAYGRLGARCAALRTRVGGNALPGRGPTPATPSHRDRPDLVDAVQEPRRVDRPGGSRAGGGLRGRRKRSPEGTRVRISATLVHVRDQTQRWAESFDREVTGILALQHEVARGVAGALAIGLLPADQTRLASAPLVNPDVYEAYSRGQSHARRLTPGDLDRALDYFQLALRKDPDSALAYTGVADVWSGPLHLGIVTPTEALPPMKAALSAALARDESLPQVHLGLALMYAWTEWNWPAAEPAFQRAVELAPNSGEARAHYADYLYIIGRSAEGTDQMQRAVELDPLSELVRTVYAGILGYTHRFDELAAHTRNVLRTTPDDAHAWDALGTALHLLGRYEEALEDRAAGARHTRRCRDAAGLRHRVRRGWLPGRTASCGGNACRPAAATTRGGALHPGR